MAAIGTAPVVAIIAREMRATMRLPAIAIAVLISGDTANAQTTNAPAEAAANETIWSFSAAAYTYILSDSRHCVQPTVSASCCSCRFLPAFPGAVDPEY